MRNSTPFYKTREAALLGLCLCTSTVLDVVAMAALGRLAFDPVSGGWRVQLIRLGLYPFALLLVAAVALIFHIAVRFTVGNYLDALLDRIKGQSSQP